MGVIRDVSWGLAAVVVFVSVPARAQAPTNDRVAAEALFEEGRKLAAGDGRLTARLRQGYHRYQGGGRGPAAPAHDALA